MQSRTTCLMSEYQLVHNARAWTLNSERTAHKGHWTKKSAQNAEWRYAFFIYAKQAKIPKLKSIDVEVRQICPTRRMPDPVSCVGAAKAAIDGVTEAGVIPNDTGRYVHSVKFYAPELGERDQLILLIRGEPA